MSERDGERTELKSQVSVRELTDRQTDGPARFKVKAKSKPLIMFVKVSDVTVADNHDDHLSLS